MAAIKKIAKMAAIIKNSCHSIFLGRKV